MKRTQLGQSDLTVSELALGCMSLGNNQRQNSEIIKTAFDRGVNLFDTADLYDQGYNEMTLGQAVKGFRQEVYLATKVGNVWREDGSGWDWNPTPKHILSAVDKSLERLGTDYIDLYQLHGGTIEDPIDDILEAFESLKQSGKIRHYGISSIRPNVIREYVERGGISSCMMQYNLLDRRPEETCFELLKSNEIGVIVRGALARGLLAGKPAKSYLDFPQRAVHAVGLRINEVSFDRGTSAQTALQFVHGHDAVTTIAIGARTLEQLNECLDMGRAPRLTQEEYAQLQAAIPASKYEHHR